MAKIEPRHLEQALSVRRGQRRIRELPEADQAPVTAFLRIASDTQLAELARSREQRQPRASLLVPHRSYTPKHALRRG